jgi:hypothetical protein
LKSKIKCGFSGRSGIIKKRLCNTSGGFVFSVPEVYLTITGKNILF